MNTTINSQKLIMTKYGENFRDCIKVVEEDINEPDDDQILVKNFYAGVNGVYDLNMIRNKVSYIKFTPPHDLGIEAVGEIIKVGRKIKDLKEGDHVSTWSVGGGYKHYQLLKSLPESPQMPTGYPGMMLLSFLPPIWFWVMNKKLNNLS